MLISDNSPVRKNYFDSNIIKNGNARRLRHYKWTILKRTSPEVKCLHPTSSRREMCTLSVSNVIYHKFSHGAAFYTLNGKNVNVMLEYPIFANVFLSKKCEKQKLLSFFQQKFSVYLVIKS